MRVELNGENREVTADTLAKLLVECGYSGRVATAVNEEFVPASMRAMTELNVGDRVEVLAPMQGG